MQPNSFGDLVILATFGPHCSSSSSSSSKCRSPWRQPDRKRYEIVWACVCACVCCLLLYLVGGASTTSSMKTDNWMGCPARWQRWLHTKHQLALICHTLLNIGISVYGTCISPGWITPTRLKLKLHKLTRPDLTQLELNRTQFITRLRPTWPRSTGTLDQLFINSCTCRVKAQLD